LPEEKDRIEKLAKERESTLRIVPRIAIGKKDHPEKILAYQMMGRQKDGDMCPFLDLENHSPHGGFACMIYKERPLACSAYPVLDVVRTNNNNDSLALLDNHCQFCKHQGCTSTSVKGLEQELESLSTIQANVRIQDEADGTEEKKEEGRMHVWRYATATGKHATLDEGWVLEQ
jgi:Fe-S-cluster containining protein